MAQGTGILTEIRLEGEGLSGLLACPPNLLPAPGQYLMASAPGLVDPLPVPLFSAGITADGLRIAPPLPKGWSAGERLSLRGPLGNGFRLPVTSRRVALAGFDASPARLLPLLHLALEQSASVALYTRAVPPGLPPEIEILPLEQLHEAPTWADYLAVDIPLRDLHTLRSALGLGPYDRPACFTQVLVLTTMPCSGLSSCGVCSVFTRDGWRLACSDGPVFDFQTLENP